MVGLRLKAWWTARRSLLRHVPPPSLLRPLQRSCVCLPESCALSSDPCAVRPQQLITQPEYVNALFASDDAGAEGPGRVFASVTSLDAYAQPVQTPTPIPTMDIVSDLDYEVRPLPTCITCRIIAHRSPIYVLWQSHAGACPPATLPAADFCNDTQACQGSCPGLRVPKCVHS